MPKFGDIGNEELDKGFSRKVMWIAPNVVVMLSLLPDDDVQVRPGEVTYELVSTEWLETPKND